MSDVPEPLRPLYDALAPDPGADYGAMPWSWWARDKATGANRFAMPSSVRDGLLGIVDAATGTETGRLTDRAIASTVMGGMGAGLSRAPRGALAAGAARRPGMRNPLAMDTASRDARARDMGFLRRMGDDDFLTVYHGTNQEISPGFLLDPPGRTTQSEAAKMGISTAARSSVAEEFAEMAARAPGARQGSGQNILPLRIRADRVATLRLPEGVKDLEVKGALLDAWDQGFDAVQLLNYTTPGGQTGQTIFIAKDPSQLRSPWAAFDPAKRDSNDPLAARMGLAPVAPTGMRAPDEKPQLVRMRPPPEYY